MKERKFIRRWKMVSEDDKEGIKLLLVIFVPFVVGFLISNTFFIRTLNEVQIDTCKYVAQITYDQGIEMALQSVQEYQAEMYKQDESAIISLADISIESMDNSVKVGVKDYYGKVIGEFDDEGVVFLFEKETFSAIKSNVACGFLFTIITVIIFGIIESKRGFEPNKINCIF